MSNIIEKPIFADTPDHQPGGTSSIGGIWPPEISFSERIKAFYNIDLILSETSLSVVKHEFVSSCRQLDGANLTRVQFRALIGEQFLKDHAEDVFFQTFTEAVVPLERSSAGQKLVITYLGFNHPCRRSSPADLETAGLNLAVAKTFLPRSPEEIFNKALSNGYTIEILNKTNNLEQIIDSLSELYARFNWDRKDVIKLVLSPSNIIAVARDHGEIVSAGIAELGQIRFADSSLRMAEITEAATLEGHGNQGLYTALSALLLVELARLSHANSIFNGSLDVVFGECNALSRGVLQAVRYQGRTYSAEVSADYGFPGRGLLHQQVPIAGVPRSTAYNDLFPAFLTPSVLYQRYLNI